jgi:hypothetical protein
VAPPEAEPWDDDVARALCEARGMVEVAADGGRRDVEVAGGVDDGAEVQATKRDMRAAVTTRARAVRLAHPDALSALIGLALGKERW